MSSISPKRAIFEQFAMVAQALANAHRVELIELVAQGERSVDELARLSGLTVTNASQHLHLLRRAGLWLRGAPASTSCIGSRSATWWIC